MDRGDRKGVAKQNGIGGADPVSRYRAGNARSAAALPAALLPTAALLPAARLAARTGLLAAARLLAAGFPAARLLARAFPRHLGALLAALGEPDGDGLLAA